MSIEIGARKALLRGVMLIGALSAVTGCTWVKLSDAGAMVQQVDANAVADCQHVGKVSTQTRNKVVMERSNAKVREELLVLARNEAAAVGGDTIAASGPAVDGRQEFDVYRCRNDG